MNNVCPLNQWFSDGRLQLKNGPQGKHNTNNTSSHKNVNNKKNKRFLYEPM